MRVCSCAANRRGPRRATLLTEPRWPRAEKGHAVTSRPARGQRVWEPAAGARSLESQREERAAVGGDGGTKWPEKTRPRNERTNEPGSINKGKEAEAIDQTELRGNMGKEREKLKENSSNNHRLMVRFPMNVRRV